MTQNLRRDRRGFTLVEIMIVVAIIGVLAALAVPSFLRARSRSQATDALNFCRVIDAALDQYATENGKLQDGGVQAGDLNPYIKNLEKYGTVQNETFVDRFGNTIAVGPSISSGVHVSATTKASLLNATGGDAFWGPYS